MPLFSASDRHDHVHLIVAPEPLNALRILEKSDEVCTDINRTRADFVVIEELNPEDLVTILPRKKDRAVIRPGARPVKEVLDEFEESGIISSTEWYE